MIAALIFFALFWIACGVIDYGLTFAYFQRGYPELAEELYWENRFFALWSIPLGLCALLASLSVGHYKHGFKWS